MDKDNFDEILELALSEDLGEVGDVTSRAIFKDEVTVAVLKSKDEGVLAGLPFFEKVFLRINPDISIQILKKDGDFLTIGETVALLKGPTVSILEGERMAINFLSFLSGIATETKKSVEAAESAGKSIILDTRKTLPGYRQMSKYAVLQGGGQNHRIGLFDMVMIKDNHVDAAGSITKAVEKVRSRWGSKYRIEVECRSQEEVEEALNLSVDVIMLDNMTPEEVIKSVELGKNKVQFEASGNMNIERILQYAPTGVDFISIGGLTHSVKAFDFSMVIS